MRPIKFLFPNKTVTEGGRSGNDQVMQQVVLMGLLQIFPDLFPKQPPFATALLRSMPPYATDLLLKDEELPSANS